VPIYNYKCGRCKKEYEYFHVRSDDKAICPHCGSSDPKKLPSKNVTAVINGASAKNHYGLKKG
jgi:putative FmdB family regulatory protein